MKFFRGGGFHLSTRFFFFFPMLSAPSSGSVVEFIGQELFKGSNESILLSLRGAKRCLANSFVVVSCTNRECACACVCVCRGEAEK